MQKCPDIEHRARYGLKRLGTKKFQRLFDHLQTARATMEFRRPCARIVKNFLCCRAEKLSNTPVEIDPGRR